MLKNMKFEDLFKDSNFEIFFKRIDTDGSGDIDKNEMTQFIKLMIGNCPKYHNHTDSPSCKTKN